MKYRDTRDAVLAVVVPKTEKRGDTYAFNAAGMAAVLGLPYDHIRYVLLRQVAAKELKKSGAIYTYRRPS